MFQFISNGNKSSSIVQQLFIDMQRFVSPFLGHSRIMWTGNSTRLYLAGKAHWSGTLSLVSSYKNNHGTQKSVKYFFKHKTQIGML